MSLDKEAPLAQAIQGAVQPKLIENGWVAEDADTELSEYITLMVINGKTQQQVVSEVGTELLGVGEDDPAVAELARWLFQQVPILNAQINGGGQQAMEQFMGADGHQQSAQNDAPQPIPTAQDSQMDDAGAPEGVYVSPQWNRRTRREAYSVDPLAQYTIPQYNYHQTLTNNSPSGPKAMRNGAAAGSGRGRDKRMLGQLNRQLDRSQDDPLRKIKGAAGGQAGRINAHAGREPPRGPRGGAAAGMQRMMNGRPGQGMMPQGGPGSLNPQQQMQFLQMMEMQSQMMAQMFNGQPPNMQNPQHQQRGGGKSLFDRVDKRQNGGAKNNRQHIHNGGMSNSDTTMEMDTGADDGAKRKDPFDTLCRFNDKCTVPTCPYAHQGPAAAPGTTIDLSDRCSFGAACENKKCAGKHPSPAQRRQHLKDEVDCKFYPNCTNPSCPFRHPDMPACRNGADCTTAGCKFVHSKIMCRYNPCLNPNCVYKHEEGQKRGKFEDKVWTAGGEGFDRDAAMQAESTGKSDRFQGLKQGETAEEELILPGRTTPERGAADEGIVS
ncbi:hypothetical protein Q7P37_003120 [Cladosporium fusiforme]